MHRVQTSKRRSVVLRIISYTTIVILTVVTSAVLLLVAQGYRLSEKDGTVVESGLLLVKSQPEPGIIYINGVEKDNAAPGRFTLEAGSYEVSLERQGYHGWKKQVTIPALGVRDVQYPLMIPKELKPRSIATVPKLVQPSQSPDHKYILGQIENEKTMQLITVDPKKPEVNTITVPDVVARENAAIGSLVVVRWGDGHTAMLKQTLPSGKSTLYLLDISRPSEMINLSSIVGDNVSAENIQFVENRVDQVYALKDTRLLQFTVKDGQSKLVMDHVQAYRSYPGDVLAFTRLAADGATLESGIWSDATATVIHKMPLASGSGTPILNYSSYEGENYFAVGRSGAEAVTIYKNPLKKPVLPTQLPLITLTTPPASYLDSSAGGQFLLIGAGKSSVVFNLDESKRHQFDSSGDLAPGLRNQWINGQYLTTPLADGRVVLGEYDGQNQHELTTVSPGTRLYFSTDLRYAYRFNDTADGMSMDAISLVAGKE